MSRSRLEKNPDKVCGFTWDSESDAVCPHSCQVPVAEHGDQHACCSGVGGRIALVPGSGDPS